MAARTQLPKGTSIVQGELEIGRFPFMEAQGADHLNVLRYLSLGFWLEFFLTANVSFHASTRVKASPLTTPPPLFYELPPTVGIRGIHAGW